MPFSGEAARWLDGRTPGWDGQAEIIRICCFDQKIEVKDAIKDVKPNVGECDMVLNLVAFPWLETEQLNRKSTHTTVSTAVSFLLSSTYKSFLKKIRDLDI